MRADRHTVRRREATPCLCARACTGTLWPTSTVLSAGSIARAHAHVHGLAVLLTAEDLQRTACFSTRSKTAYSCSRQQDTRKGGGQLASGAVHLGVPVSVICSVPLSFELAL